MLSSADLEWRQILAEMEAQTRERTTGGEGEGEQEGWSFVEAKVEGGTIALQLHF